MAQGAGMNRLSDRERVANSREGHEMAWEFASPGGAYTGRLLIDGTIYTTSEATKKFLTPNKKTKS